MKKLLAALIGVLLATSVGAASAQDNPGKAAAGATAAKSTIDPTTGLTKRYGLTLLSKLKYPPGFKHLDYVNPDAPKGGTLHRYTIGTFDTFNPYTIKGNPVVGLNLVYETLMESPSDAISDEYGLIAKSVEVPKNLSYAIYNLRPEARFQNGTPITADDVIWTFNTLKKDGAPFYRLYYQNVSKAVKIGPHQVKFVFTGPPNRELPHIIGQLPVLSKKWWSTHDFTKTTLQPPMGSGPYKVVDFDPGRYIVYQRVKDWWGRNLPLNVGRYNFDKIRFDYYRDETVALEAFKAGRYDFRSEMSSLMWATGYNFPARRDGLVKLEAVPESRPTGMQAFAYNLRRPVFQDPVLRDAMAYAFDFPWSNKHLFYGQYTRTRSYFSNSPLAARGLPSKAELALLDPLRNEIPKQVFTKVYAPPTTNGSGNIRGNLQIAMRMLTKAGYHVRNGRLISPKTGKPVTFEILLVEPAFERVVAPFLANLRRLGIFATMRTVDQSQYINRVRSFDFDMIVASFPESDSPGNEQRDYWGSAAADRPGSRNVIGIKNPAVDTLINKIVDARTRDQLVTAVHALDRVLLWNYYVIPQWHVTHDRIAYWNKFGFEKHPKYGVDISAWWYDAAKAKVVRREKP